MPCWLLLQKWTRNPPPAPPRQHHLLRRPWPLCHHQWPQRPQPWRQLDLPQLCRGAALPLAAQVPQQRRLWPVGGAVPQGHGRRAGQTPLHPHDLRPRVAGQNPGSTRGGGSTSVTGVTTKPVHPGRGAASAATGTGGSIAAVMEVLLRWRGPQLRTQPAVHHPGPCRVGAPRGVGHRRPAIHTDLAGLRAGGPCRHQGTCTGQVQTLLGSHAGLQEALVKVHYLPRDTQDTVHPACRCQDTAHIPVTHTGRLRATLAQGPMVIPEALHATTDHLRASGHRAPLHRGRCHFLGLRLVRLGRWGPSPVVLAALECCSHHLGVALRAALPRRQCWHCQRHLCLWRCLAQRSQGLIP